MQVVGVTDFNRRDVDKPVKERTVCSTIGANHAVFFLA